MMYTQVQSSPHTQHGTQGTDAVQGEGSASGARSDTGRTAAVTGPDSGTEMGSDRGIRAVTRAGASAVSISSKLRMTSLSSLLFCMFSFPTVASLSSSMSFIKAAIVSAAIILGFVCMLSRSTVILAPVVAID
jgi:hypothetical protein